MKSERYTTDLSDTIMAGDELLAYITRCRYRFINGSRMLRSLDVPCYTHEHEFMQIIYHATGWGASRIGDAVIPIQPGSVFIYPAGSKHDQTIGAPMEDWCLHLWILNDAPPAFPHVWYVPQVGDPLLISEFEYLADAPPPRSSFEQLSCDCRVGAILTALLAMCETPVDSVSATSKRYAEGAYRYMKMHFRTLQRIEEVAEYLQISHSYLRALYRQYYHSSLIESLTQLRIERAEDLLRNTSLKLAAISNQCGFANERYFSMVFKRMRGCTPGAFRRRTV